VSEGRAGELMKAMQRGDPGRPEKGAAVAPNSSSYKRELERNKIPERMLRLRIVWTCSDEVHHEHRWWWTAWLCGRLQYYRAAIWYSRGRT
jgi:hypothetical protein